MIISQTVSQLVHYIIKFDFLKNNITHLKSTPNYENYLLKNWFIKSVVKHKST